MIRRGIISNGNIQKFTTCFLSQGKYTSIDKQIIRCYLVLKRLAGVGGANVYGVVFKVVVKYRLLIMWNLRFVTHGFSTK